MMADSWWMFKGILFLWLYYVGFCSSFENNQVCVETNCNGTSCNHCYDYGWASFGTLIPTPYLMGVVVLANPREACKPVKPLSSYNQSGYSGNWFLLIDVGDCDFDKKGAYATEGGFNAAIIRSLKSDSIEPIGGGSDDRKVDVPVVYIGETTGQELEKNDFSNQPSKRILLTPQEFPQIWDYEFYMIPFAIIVGICFILMAMFMISRYYRHYLEQRRNRLSPTNLKKIPTKKFKKGDDYYDVCAICLEEYKDGERLRILPCEHAYHCKCVDPWLTEGKRTCPVCKRPVTHDNRTRNRPRRTDVEATGELTNEADETTPLIASTASTSNSMTV
ncbi:E3 ubiquitin-protein ligase RNF13-like [Orbicella faveolata]|uniref:E3 ubiquitin-protein ligase RNF13-like n=1 Tax=Orbicella faveolata TaxID=48498 RepID=UPI0009E44A05|nr:E3 ubiquitin-protein ligase RNF13-like [Orbicella faveolata]